MKRIAGDLAKTFLIVIVFSIVGYLLLSLVYLIPTDNRISQNVKESATIFEAEGEYPILMYNYNSRLDNWTDSIMILEASYHSEDNPFIASLKNNYSVNESLGPVVSLIEQNTVAIDNQVFDNISYARYWHGYLVILKPLLWLFDYGTIRCLLAFTELTLFILVIYELFKKDRHLIIPYACLFLFLNPVSTMLSMQFAWNTIIMLISSFLIIKFEKTIKDNMYFFFTVIGCCTCYFDLLTFPIISLTIPLILYFGINKDMEIKEKMIVIIFGTLSWLIGYAGIWIIKWIIATWLTDINVIADGIASFINRTSHENATNAISYLSTIMLNLGCSFQISWVLIVLYYIIICLKGVIVTKRKSILLNNLIPYIFLGLYPFIWCMAVMNHSYAHCWFTYRIFGTCVFAFTSYISLNINDCDIITTGEKSK